MTVYEWLFGTKYAPPSSCCAGVYCNICGQSHNYPACVPSLLMRLHYWWRYATDPVFRKAVQAERDLADMLTKAIQEEINKEILAELMKGMS